MIRLRSLKLEGFLSHISTSLNFDDCSYVIIGNNASGKTSILRGIFFALFGTDVVIGRRNIQKLINKQTNSLNVELSFVHNGKEYFIKRKLTSRGKSFAELSCNGKKEAVGVNNVNLVISENLKLDMNVFRNTTYVPQGELVSFLEGDPRERREILNRLIGIDVIAEKSELLKEFRKNVQIRLSELQGIIDSATSLKEMLSDLERKRENLKEEIRSLHSEFSHLNQILKENESLLKEFEEKGRDYLNFQRSLSIYQDQLKNLEEELSNLEKKINYLQSLEKQVPALKEFSKKLPILKKLREKLLTVRELRQGKGLLQEKLKFLREKQKELSLNKDKKVNLQKEKEFLGRKSDPLRKELTRLEEELKQLEVLRSEHEKLNFALREESILLKERERKLKMLTAGDTLKLAQEKSDLERAINKVREEISRLKTLKKQHEERIEKLSKKEIKRCPLCRSEISESTRENLVSESVSEVERLEKLIETKNEHLLKLEKDLRNTEKNLKEALLKKAEMDSISSEILKSRRKIEDLENRLSKLNFDPDIYNSMKGRREILNQEFSKLKDRILAIDSELKSLEEANGRLQKAINELSERLILSKIKEVERKESQILDEVKSLKHKEGIEASSLKQLEDVIELYENSVKKLNNLEGQLKDLANVEAAYKKKVKDKNSLIRVINDLEKKIKSLNYDGKKHESIKKLFNSVSTQASSLNEEIARLSGQLSQVEAQIDETRKRLEELKSKEELSKKVKLVYDVVLYLENGFNPIKGFTSRLRDILIPEITHFCKVFFEEFNFDFGELNITEDLTVEFGIPGQGTLTLDQLSGGQKVAFALSLRFAMARKFMSTLDLLMLDEPTIHLDTERKQELANLLMKLKGKIPQMIIVTHDPELEVAGDKILRVRKENGVSIVEF